MKKVSLKDFCTEMQRNLEDFEMDKNIQSFSSRSQSEWFKLLGDYLGLSSGKIIFVNDLNENDYRDDETA